MNHMEKCGWVVTHSAYVGYGDTDYYDETCDEQGVTTVTFVSTHGGGNTRLLLCATHTREAIENPH